MNPSECERGYRRWISPGNKTIMSDTPRTNELSKVVQNQNWGFRDMQMLAQNLERENFKLKEEIAALTGGYVENGVPLRHLGGDRFQKI